MAQHAHVLTGEKYLCMAGGVALNCVANGKLLREGPFKDIWIQPAAGDAGGALGAAQLVWHKIANKPRAIVPGKDAMQGSFLGPSYSDNEIQAFLDQHDYLGTRYEKSAWAEHIAKAIASDKVVGLCQGRMEFGPRALGGRSIIADARSEKMQSVMNLKIKYRESFRPFAPACLEEHVSDYFEMDRPSPYMLMVAPVKKNRCIGLEDAEKLPMYERINQKRSDIPAITHVDYSARIQTVTEATNPGFHAIIKAFEQLTGYGIVINTSFNVRGEPIVCTPEDAYRCFMRTEMDVLVLGNYILHKTDQPEWIDKADWRLEYKLD
jgi:carbamoyltransferase